MLQDALRDMVVRGRQGATVEPSVTNQAPALRRGQRGRFYGTPPVVANDGPDDVSQGRLLPSTSVDQYAATLGKWFDISDADLLTVLPNLSNWNASQRTLEFV